MTPQHSIGPYDFKYTEDGDKVPPTISITFYPELQLHPGKYMYENSDPPFQSRFGKGKHMTSRTNQTFEFYSNPQSWQCLRVIANFVFPYICSFLLYLHQLMFYQRVYEN